MHIFELEKIDWIEGKIDFYYLKKNGQNQFLDFEGKLKSEGAYESELLTLQTRMQEMAELKLLPATKCKNLTPKNDSAKESMRLKPKI